MGDANKQTSAWLADIAQELHAMNGLLMRLVRQRGEDGLTDVEREVFASEWAFREGSTAIGGGGCGSCEEGSERGPHRV